MRFKTMPIIFLLLSILFALEAFAISSEELKQLFEDIAHETDETKLSERIQKIPQEEWQENITINEFRGPLSAWLAIRATVARNTEALALLQQRQNDLFNTSFYEREEVISLRAVLIIEAARAGHQDLFNELLESQPDILHQQVSYQEIQSTVGGIAALSATGPTNIHISFQETIEEENDEQKETDIDQRKIEIVKNNY